MDVTAWDERYRSSERLWSEGPNLFVADRLGPATPGRGLDLACGEGRNAVWLASKGWKMTAVDFSAVAIERGRRQSEEVEWVLADLLTWEPEGLFDLVLVAYLQVPSPDLEKVVRRAREWLEPGGELFLLGHDLSNLEEGWGGPQQAELLWEAPVIVAWLEGMTLVEAQVVRRPVETNEGRRYARDALVRTRA